MTVQKWKTDWSQLALNLISHGIYYLLTPSLMEIVLENNFKFNIDNETFWAIWIIVFVSRVIRTLINPPTVRLAQITETQEEILGVHKNNKKVEEVKKRNV